MRPIERIIADNGGEVVVDTVTAANINAIEGYQRYCTECGQAFGSCDCEWTYAPLTESEEWLDYIDCE